MKIKNVKNNGVKIPNERVSSILEEFPKLARSKAGKEILPAIKSDNDKEKMQ